MKMNEKQERWMDLVVDRFKHEEPPVDEMDAFVMTIAAIDAGLEDEMTQYLEDNPDVKFQECWGYLAEMLPEMEIVDDEDDE